MYWGHILSSFTALKGSLENARSFLQVCGLSITWPQKIMIFQQISFQPGQCMQKQSLFSLKTWNKHESRTISRIGSFPANFDMIHRHRATYWKSTYFPIVQLTPYPSDQTRYMAPGQLGKQWRCIYQHGHPYQRQGPHLAVSLATAVVSGGYLCCFCTSWGMRNIKCTPTCSINVRRSFGIPLNTRSTRYIDMFEINGYLWKLIIRCDTEATDLKKKLRAFSRDPLRAVNELKMWPYYIFGHQETATGHTHAFTWSEVPSENLKNMAIFIWFFSVSKSSQN